MSRFTSQMPPKRSSGTSPTQPQVKMIKVGSPLHVQEFSDGSVEDKYRMAEESSPSPLPTNEPETFDFDEEHLASQGIRTDTISLLMKIEQLQSQLKYERRCRILAERELRELKEYLWCNFSFCLGILLVGWGCWRCLGRLGGLGGVLLCWLSCLGGDRGGGLGDGVEGLQPVGWRGCVHF
ncbi:hypothetical protein ATANTOWER_000216 [Ataeniobius toweri]|uniref:Uncharacterized protein n=2 Tax=Goodeidae TaxID=28758 RepID=A0ABU7AMI2_9TELE|nr:hypothetical protein [Ataeniobius toweri]